MYRRSTFARENLPYDINAGMDFYPAWELMTNNEGEFLLPVRQMYFSDDCDLKLLFLVEDVWVEDKIDSLNKKDIKITVNISGR